MGNEDEFNMYDDLDELLIEPSSKKEQKLIEEETKKKILAENEKIEKLKEQINSLQVELAEVTKSRNQLHENMNKLLKTSITEIQRKDTQIHDLRRENDNFVFRKNFKRNQQSRTIATQSYFNSNVKTSSIGIQVDISRYDNERSKKSSSSDEKFTNGKDGRYSKYDSKDSRYRNSRDNQKFNRSDRDSNRYQRKRSHSRSPKDQSSMKRHKYSDEKPKSNRNGKSGDLRKELLKDKVQDEYKLNRNHDKKSSDKDEPKFELKIKKAQVELVDEIPNNTEIIKETIAIDNESSKTIENSENNLISDVDEKQENELKIDEKVVEPEISKVQVSDVKENEVQAISNVIINDDKITSKESQQNDKDELEDGEIEDNDEVIDKILSTEENSEKIEELPKEIEKKIVEKSPKKYTRNPIPSSPLREKLPRKTKTNSPLNKILSKPLEISPEKVQQDENFKISLPIDISELSKNLEIQSNSCSSPIVSPNKSSNSINESNGSTTHKRRSYTKEINEEGVTVVTIIRHKKKKKKSD